MLAHRQFVDHKALGAALGAGGGFIVGLGTGLAIIAASGAFRENVIYSAPPLSLLRTAAP